MTSSPVLVVGGGLAGLSSAYHLKKKPHLVIEREKDMGGTARSFKINKFTFDITGHLLHLHHPYTRKLITSLLKGHFFSCERNTAIFSEGVYTDYPYQANTYGLSQKTVEECVLGYLKVYLENQTTKKNFQKMNFFDWCHHVFGKGISDHFMIPYNEKLYQTKAKNLSVEWCGRFVPKPKLEDVIKGALQSHSKKFGYNATFLYPKKGGIQELARQLSKRVKGPLHPETSLMKLDWKKKKAVLSNGETVSYSHLVNTIPLAELLKRMPALPASIQKAKRQLKCVSILCLNIGVKRARISKRSWVYFPEGKFPFYRVGFPMNFTPHVVPKGCSSMYVEVPMKWAKGKSKKKILSAVRSALIEARILKKSDRLPVVQFLPVRYAYVIYDKQRANALKQIFSFLKKNKIQSIGRYGAWKYSFMEEAILDGKKAAEKIIRGSY